MSSKAAAIRYGKHAVQGSMAYDLTNPALYPDYTYGRPLDIPAAPEISEEVVGTKQAVSAQAVSPVAVIGCLVVAALLIISLLTRVQLTQVSESCVELEDSIAELQDDRSKLLIAYESAFNLTEIEDYAINTLGMQKPRSDQIYYVSGSAQDKAVVLGAASEPEGVADRVGDFLSAAAEYLGLSGQ